MWAGNKGGGLSSWAGSAGRGLSNWAGNYNSRQSSPQYAQHAMNAGGPVNQGNIRNGNMGRSFGQSVANVGGSIRKNQGNVAFGKGLGNGLANLGSSKAISGFGNALSNAHVGYNPDAPKTPQMGNTSGNIIGKMPGLAGQNMASTFGRNPAQGG